MTELKIQRATAADADELAGAYRSAYRENRRLGFPAKAESATNEEVVEWIRKYRMYVATVKGEVVGGVRLEVTGSDRDADSEDDGDSKCDEDSERVKLSRLGVHEDWKGEGVGGRLLEHAEDAIREWGYATVWLTTPETHPYLPELYRRRGYEETRAYPLEYREYDEIVMEKRLR